MSLLDTERGKYEKVWDVPAYREANQGLQLWQLHRDIFPAAPKSALDIGCGNGRLFAQWNAEGIDGFGVDFAANSIDASHPNRDKFSLQCLWSMQFDHRFDMGLCADVMEHIPPEKVDAVLAAIVGCCDVSILQIANYPSVFGDLHLLLHDAGWWLNKLSEFGTAKYLPDVHRRGVEEYVFRLTA